VSRAYRIQVKESLKRDVSAEDSIQAQIELLEILPPEQMGELLTRELKERGFEPQSDGTMVRENGDVTITVDPCSGEVLIRAKAEQTIEVEGKRDGVTYDDVGPRNQQVKERLKQELISDLEQRIEKQAADVQSAATGKLERELADLQPELNEVVNRVTADALKQKAAQMGQIREISEDAETGSLTIKVEV
jgi:hypothetical protein